MTTLDALHSARLAQRLVLAAVLVGLFLMHGLGMGHQPVTAHAMTSVSAAMGTPSDHAGPAAVTAAKGVTEPAATVPGQPPSPMDMTGAGAMCLAVLSLACAGWLALAALLASSRRRRNRDSGKTQGDSRPAPRTGRRSLRPPSLLSLCVSRT